MMRKILIFVPFLHLLFFLLNLLFFPLNRLFFSFESFRSSLSSSVTSSFSFCLVVFELSDWDLLYACCVTNLS